MALAPGTRLGAYEITSAVGAGGMGEVYRARDSRLGRDVAIKVLPADLAGDAERSARFHREAQLLAQLQHPNIATVFGVEEASGVRAIAMEFVDGDDLSARIAHGPIPIDDARAIAKQIAGALEAAHEQGIIHRDLKPANIKLRADGTVKVLDFGLAKAVETTATSSANVMNSPTLTARATQLGTILGTAAYMAPEQAKGRPVDRRADIWAFGVVLFEMLSGQRAFKGDDASDVLAAVLRQEIDWKALPENTPTKIRRILERCLERDPKRRQRDIGDVVLELDEPDASAPVAATTAIPKASPLSRALPWIAALVVAGMSVAWSLLRATPQLHQPVVRSSMILKEVAAFVDVSRDGSRLVYAVAASPTTSGITLRMLDQFTGKTIPGTGTLSFSLLSPDGQWVAFNSVADSSLKKVPITGGTPTRLCNCSLQNGGAWGDDNTLVYSSSTGLNRVSADGGEPESITKVDATKGEASHIRPQFLPGGKRILFTVKGKDGPRFAVTDLGTGTYTIVGRGGDNGKFVPAGHLVYVRELTLFAVPFDLSRLQVTGGEVPMVENISPLGPAGTADYAVADNGTLAYFVGSNIAGTTLAWVDRGGTPKPIGGPSQQQWGTGRLSPNGEFVANGIVGARNIRDVWTFDVNRGTLTRLTFGKDGDDADAPIWSPDGRTVYYTGRVDGKWGVFAVPADASSRAKLVLATEQRPFPSSITPDGHTLLYSHPNADQKSQIFKVSLVPGPSAPKPEPLHEPASHELLGAISPDGRWVAYMSSESGTNEVYVIPFPGPGPKTRVSLDGGSSPRWSRDGRELFYWSKVPIASLMAVAVTTSPTFKAEQPRKLFEQFSTTTWDTTSDPNRFLVERDARQEGSTLNIVTNWFEELKHRAPPKR